MWPGNVTEAIGAYRRIVIQLAGHDPARVQEIEARCTHTEIAQAQMVRLADLREQADAKINALS